MNVVVVGLGHVGLVTAAALATLGHKVCGFDIDEDRLSALGAGQLPFLEPGLAELIDKARGDGSLFFSSDPASAIRSATVAVVCVGRPADSQGDRSLTAVEQAVRTVARAASADMIVIIKSTVPPGTTRRATQLLSQERPDLMFHVASSPEFLREGQAVEDSLSPHRLVVGSENDVATDVVRSLYAPLLESGVRIIETDPQSAELGKLASNAFLALKISFVNALARLSERTGGDVRDVSAILGSDPRIGEAFLAAGLGYGGYCLPKDVATLQRVSRTAGYEFGLLDEVVLLNEQAIEAVAATIETAVWNLEGKTVALLGLTFKAGTDDIRESPAVALARRLLERGSHVTAYDPALVSDQFSLPIEIKATLDGAVAGASCAVICTAWPEFEQIDLARLGSTMGERILVDARNQLDRDVVESAGFRYYGVGASSTALDNHL